MSETESEAKWTLGERSWLTLKQLLPQLDSLRQTNLFFDDSEGHLRQSKWALRLRTENQKYFLTAKGPSHMTGQIVHRPEIEVELQQDEVARFNQSFKLSELSNAPVQFLMEQFGDLELQAFLSFTNQRDVLLWEGHSLELDCSECLGQKRYELEWESSIEILEQNLSKFEKWLQQEKIETSHSSMGKLSWALSLQ